jgi:uncharacterized protein YkwD
MPRTLGQGLAFLLGFWIALALAPFWVELARADSNAVSHAELETRLHQEVNALRARRHLIPLERDPALDAVARAHSADMARRGYLNHVNPQGQNPLDRLRAAGIEGFSLAAENTGLTDRSDPSREILQGWIASPVHRYNLHAPPFNRTGIGVSRAASGAYYYTQLYVTVPRP